MSKGVEGRDGRKKFNGQGNLKSEATNGFDSNEVIKNRRAIRGHVISSCARNWQTVSVMVRDALVESVDTASGPGRTSISSV